MSMDEDKEMEIERPYVARKKPNILITGTPGTGKTTLSRLLVEYVPELQVISVGDLIRDQKLYDTWNEEFDIPEFDDDMVVDALEFVHEAGGYILDFHSSGFFPERWFDLVVLLRTNNTPLFDRLTARNYSKKKIDENLSCEMLETTADEAKEAYKGDVLMELQSDQESDVQANLEKIIAWLELWAQKKSAHP